MTVLLPEQAEALRHVHAACQALNVDAVVIGAVAYRVWVQDEHRATEDLDIVVALDLAELPQLTEPLRAAGWRQDRHREHRWISPNGARVDLLPAGPKARREHHLDWPIAETRMSLVGFDHVFDDAGERELAPGLKARVVPLLVLALLKIVSYLDQPGVRRKDLDDLAGIMSAYEEEGERRFSDDVIDSGVDYNEAGAYLLGWDLARLCGEDSERDTVERFCQVTAEQPDEDDETYSGAGRVARQSAAFARGWASLRRRE
jgi:predicted nucleotidyltransferase